MRIGSLKVKYESVLCLSIIINLNGPKVEVCSFEETFISIKDYLFLSASLLIA